MMTTTVQRSPQDDRPVWARRQLKAIAGPAMSARVNKAGPAGPFEWESKKI
jgi:hypothetical protein